MLPAIENSQPFKHLLESCIRGALQGEDVDNGGRGPGYRQREVNNNKVTIN